jgi:class 3 adenylate cyclase/AmiR/NasT family two-component response regulator
MNGPDRARPSPEPEGGVPASPGPRDAPADPDGTLRVRLATIRHELRTPINAIIGYSEMLLEDAAGLGQDDLIADVQKIRAGGHQLLGLLNDILSPAHTEEGQLHLDPERFAATLRRELGGPVSAIAGYSEVLVKEAGARGREPFVADLQKIHAAADRFLALLEDVGKASGITGGEIAADPRTARTAVMAEAAVSTIREGKPGAEAAPAGRGALLVVDDNQTNRDVLSRHLERQGHTVEVAEDGRQALALVAARTFDLVLLDVMMPELNGYEVLQRLKADPAWRDIPVLMISALDEIDSVVRCIELGAEDYLSKPFNPVLLRARISACLEKKGLRDQEKAHLATIQAQAAQLAEWNRTLEQRVQEQVAQVERLGRLKRFFSPQLAELIVAGGAADPLQTHRREVTVVFLDLRGFTAFAETAEPEEVMGVLREYHAAMGELILAHEGTLERFAGDGMMIFFNDPVPVPNPGERAIGMALAMRDRVGALAVKWRKRGYELDLGVGIAQGYATIGAIGFEGRWDYGAIGTVTNLAARLCGEAKPGQILISRRLLGTIEELVEVEPVGELSLKGFQRPVTAYDVLRLKG